MPKFTGDELQGRQCRRQSHGSPWLSRRERPDVAQNKTLRTKKHRLLQIQDPNWKRSPQHRCTEWTCPWAAFHVGQSIGPSSWWVATDICLSIVNDSPEHRLGNQLLHNNTPKVSNRQGRKTEVPGTFLTEHRQTLQVCPEFIPELYHSNQRQREMGSVRL